MDLKLVKSLVRIMKGGDVSELELEDTNAGTRIHLKRGSGSVQSGQVVHMLPGGTAMPGPGAMSYSPAPGSEAGAVESETGLPAGTQEILSPMVGTFYLAASPEAEPFTEVGTRVALEATLCIIEAMKVMNEIKAEVTGEIVEILVENGEPVEHGQPLFLIKTG